VKTLYIVRHAKSGEKQSGKQDIDRNLSDRGKSDGEKMGEHLRSLGIHPEAFISSPATRAMQTTQILTASMGIRDASIQIEDELYHGNFASMYSFVKNLDDELTTVMIFGHNPYFSSMADFFANTRIDNLPTLGVVGLEFTVQSWSEVENQAGSVVLYEYPKKLK
jgi:phosphohistidine phosphatase